MGAGKSYQGKVPKELFLARFSDERAEYTTRVAVSEMEKLSLKYDSLDSFISHEADRLVESGVLDMDKPVESSEAIFKNARYKESAKGYKILSRQEAVDTVRAKFRRADADAWFRGADTGYKPRIEYSIITQPTLRNAGMNIAHQMYQEYNRITIPFNQFLDSEITVYRGGNVYRSKENVFESFTYDKEIAQKFGKKSRVVSQKVKVRDTLGMYQTDGEYEIFVPIKLVK